MNQLMRALILVGALVITVDERARADVVLSGPDSNAGSYSTTALAAAAGGNIVESAGLTRLGRL